MSLIAYLGPPLALGQLLPGPSERIFRDTQAFAMGWYAPDAAPAIYTRQLPVYADSNLAHLAPSLHSGLWLFQATVPTGRETSADRLAAPLFYDEQLIFSVEGHIEDFRARICPLLRQFLAPAIEAEVRSNTAADYLFALLRHLLADDEEMSVEQAFADMFALLEEWLGDSAAVLNMLLSDGESLFAVRHAVNAHCLPLYYTSDEERYLDGQLVASRPLTSSEFWLPVPECHILLLNPDAPPELIAL